MILLKMDLVSNNVKLLLIKAVRESAFGSPSAAMYILKMLAVTLLCLIYLVWITAF